ncbi:unnamed protein product [Adineta steineri]|uniref:Uncharacterized protein n=1 Tax=Adineta steineri TaxID=433720 RepID=A0A815VTE8_9BILA|nr:unnamed protein product [Adineta steineri]CAF1654365.1 unnamed protein product [Adineta steineri]
MLHHHPHQGLPFPIAVRFLKPKRKLTSHQDRFFHLRTTIALNDPFLRRLYSVVSLVLDDHPYPSTRDEFQRRTYEIDKNIQELNLSSHQSKFLRRLMNETGISLVDLWQGSHVILLDNGLLYDLWSKTPAAHPRFSSHYRQIPIQQYGINFRDHQLLFGKTATDGSTWFQMEAHGFDPNDLYNDPDLAVYHGQDFLKYRFHHMNVGPFGFSPHTETTDPIILRYRPMKPKTRRR